MKWKSAAAVAALVVFCALATAGVARAESPHSPNMSLIGNWTNGTGDYQGSDLGFWGDTAVLGMYGGPGGFGPLNIADPAHPQPPGPFPCPGPPGGPSTLPRPLGASPGSPPAPT